MGVNVEDLIGRVKVPVRSVTICLDSSLMAEHDELRERLESSARERVRMAQTPEAQQVAERIQAIEAEMREASQTFKFKGLSQNALNVLYKLYPPVKGTGMTWNIDDGAADLIARAAVEPEMTKDQSERLCEALAQGQWNKLVTAAWAASTGDGAVPFSARASEVMHGSASK